MGLVQDLLKEDAEAPVAAVESSASAPAAAQAAPVESTPKVAALDDARSAAESATKFASAIRGELEKRASEGESGEGGELERTLSKCAFYIGELLRVKDADDRYASELLKEAADAAQLRRYREAVKLAGELIAQGRVEAPDDYDIDKLATELLKEDLRVVKKAAEFAGSSRLGNLGQAAEKSAVTRFDDTSDDGHRRGGDDQAFLDAHSFLLSGRA